MILHDLGRSEEALENQKRSLKMRERIFGPEHPSTAISLSNLATILKDLGKSEEALENS